LKTTISIRALSIAILLIIGIVEASASDNQSADERARTGNVDATSEPLIISRFDDQNINMRLDGRLDEPVWSRVAGVNAMSVTNPDTLVKSRFETVSKFFYTDRGLYVGIWNEQPPDTLLGRLSRRDRYMNRDGNELMLDTSGKALYGLWFDVNLGGSIGDGTILPEKSFSGNWDGSWNGDAAATDDGYTTEYFLPWSMMAMPEADQYRTMAVMIIRRVAYLDETWSWPALPFSGSKYMSGWQPIQFRDINPRRQWAVFPFAATTHDNIASTTDYQAGLDLFWRPSSNVQFTATINPDFGTIESDNVEINLTAFETFFREKRLFFVEGNEIFVTTPRANPFGSGSFIVGARNTFSSFFSAPITLLNTRRIGSAAISPDIPPGTSIADIELFKPSELRGAIKVTGQNGRLRYGVLTAIEDDARFHGFDNLGSSVRLEQQGRDFGVLRLSYEDSSAGLRSLGWMTTAVMHPDRDALVHGVDGHYISASSNWATDLQLIYSDIEGLHGYGGLGDLSYIPRKGVTHKLTFDYLDDQLDINDFGFLRRNDVLGMKYAYTNNRTDLQRLRRWDRSLSLAQKYNRDGQAIRSEIFWRNTLMFQNSMLLKTELDYFPRIWDDRNSAGNGDFRIEDRWFFETAVGTDTTRILSISLAVAGLQEDLGDLTKQIKGGFTLKPNDRLSLDLDVTYQRRDGWLLHQSGRNFATFSSINWLPNLSLEYFVSARQQLRLTMQWAGIKADEQALYQVPLGNGDLLAIDKDPTDPSADFGISRLSAQFRYRWEIAPLSDLFLVYTRGSRLITAGDDDFADFFREAVREPLVDVFVVKLRYRFGS
tara:strand:- start:5096 stop:7576 length:2481 start_codon:yes stop_codon:yes gene_type:complete